MQVHSWLNFQTFKNQLAFSQDRELSHYVTAEPCGLLAMLTPSSSNRNSGPHGNFSSVAPGFGSMQAQLVQQILAADHDCYERAISKRKVNLKMLSLPG